MSINELIISTLKPIAPIAFHEYTGSESKYMTFSVYNQSAGLIADDEEIMTVYSIQLDVFGKGNIESVVSQAKEALKQVGFERINEMDLYEIETKTFRKMLMFKTSM
ncbi:hypothetical protein [Pseudalkalibacillus sp. JSM 102089]|uniref:hypothetical protein n=1 Tax=Pseudalkalibacillus sp. JSM 102089 TaxID=3229856 RepID=UPI0035235ABC